MADNSWPQAVQSGLAANLPTGGATGWAQNTVFSGQAASNPDNNTAPAVPYFPGNVTAFYYATDTGVLYNWNPATDAWNEAGAGQAPISVVATGSTNGGATRTSNKSVLITGFGTGASTGAGIMLPQATTIPLGYRVWVANNATFATTIYPFYSGATNLDTIDAATQATLTNAKECFFTLTSISAGSTGAWISGPQGGHSA